MIEYNLDEWKDLESAILGVLSDKRVTTTHTRVIFINRMISQYISDTLKESNKENL